MKNNKGITLTSLIIYIAVMFVVLAVIMRISTYFSKNMNDAADVTFETEFEKFNLYMLEETNKKGNNVIRISEDGKEIEFKDGNIFTFTKENEDETGTIYLNNSVKICENVNNCIFKLESKTLLSVSITINEKTKDETKDEPKVKYTINSTSILPAEYQEVEYIESTGTQYIDTGYAQKNNPRIEAEIMLTSTSDLDIIGNSTAKAGCFIIDYRDKTIYYRYGTSSFTIISYSESIINKWTKCIWGSSVYHDGKLITTVSDQDFSTNTQTLLIGKGRTYGKVRFKEVKIFDNNVLVRNLIPCYRKSDNEIGMYDLVNDVFYQNSGTGYFLKGDDVIYEDEKEENLIVAEKYIIDYKARIPKTYQEVEYIESTGMQYINTLIIPNNNTNMELKMQIQANGDNFIFGVNDGSYKYGLNIYNASLYPRYGKDTQSSVGKTNLDTDFILEIRNGKYILNNSVLAEYLDIFECTNYEMYLFGRNDSGTEKTLAQMRLYYANIFDNDTLIRNFIPCSRKSDGEIGLYDLVNDVFYTNSGTGEFTAGPKVE